MSEKLPILVIDGLLVGAGLYLGHAGETALCVSTIAATAFLVAWQLLLLTTLRDTGKAVRIERSIQPTHYVQLCLQGTLYAYWGLYWDDVVSHIPSMLVQFVFAYGFDMLLSWSRLRPWRLGFGPIPIVFSLNFFLWFRDEYFVLQLGLIAAAYLAKEFIRWPSANSQGHIFNPSAFPLAVASIGMIVFQAFPISRGVDIVETFTLPPSMFEVIFLLGLVVQLKFNTIPVTLGNALAQVGFFHLAWFVVGVPISPTPINVSVFLAQTLLVTDPSTTPRSTMGRFLFGLAYGCGTYVLCVCLRLTQQPSFVDKIVMVPILNLLAPLFDRLGDGDHRSIAPAIRSPAPLLWRLGLVGSYAMLVVTILPALKTPLPRPERFPFPPPAIRSSPEVTRTLANMEYCRQVLPEPYRPFGFPSEIANYDRIKEIYNYDGPMRIGSIAGFSSGIAAVSAE